eukprot:COSAG06_NODE_6149_length_3084_cov_3.104188_3_plen_52_part_00
MNALPTSTVHPGCTVELGSNNSALVIGAKKQKQNENNLVEVLLDLNVVNIF